MFGNPVLMMDPDEVFSLVWTYVIKEFFIWKKGHFTLNGSYKSGKIKVLDHTYANCVDHTGACIFYTVSAV